MALLAAAQGRLALQVLAAVCACWWMLYWIVGTFTKGSNWLYSNIDVKVNSTFLGTDAVTFFFQIVTVVIITIAGFLALQLRRKRALKVQAKDRKASLNIWTTPVILRSPFGIITMGDLVFLAFVLFTTLWYFLKWTVKWSREDDEAWMPGDDPRWKNRIYVVGVMFGEACVIPISLLWIPVSRGSPILNVIGIPFERAVKYHIWLGLFGVWLVIAHGLVTGWYFIEVHQITNREGLFSWLIDGIAYIPGEIAFLAGIVMLVTALEYVRRKNFDLFFIAHHLYLIFILFFAFHCPWCIDQMIVPLLLFFLDRFMRFVQSRKSVDVVSAKILRSGAIELTVAKPPSARYHPLSFLYVRLPSVSKLMWHPFSVASSPLDGTNKIVIYVKPLGNYTKTLHDVLISSNNFQRSGEKSFRCPFSFKVGLEGPYGSESVFYLRYKSLVLVAGGIGVTPFLAIIKDMLHRYRLGQEYLPSNIKLIICVKHVSELHILDTVAPNSIFPGYDDQLKLTIQSFVTQEDQELLQSPPNSKSEREGLDSNPSILQDGCYRDDEIVLYSPPGRAPQEMKTISSVGHAGWVFTTFAATYISYFVIFGILSLKSQNLAEDNGPVRVMYYLVAMSVSIVVFGGGVMLLWSIWDKRARKSDSQVLSQSPPATSPSHESSGAERDLETAPPTTDDSIWREDVTFGRRPSWRDSFNELAKQYSGQDVGVMVSGVLKMQQDVASECRRHSLSRSSSTVFHYHSVSFDL